MGVGKGTFNDYSIMQIKRQHTVKLSTGEHLFFVRSMSGGAQFLLFNGSKDLVASGTLDFEETPWPKLRPLEFVQGLPVEEIEAWMRTWPPEDRLLIDVMSPVPYPLDEEATSLS